MDVQTGIDLIDQISYKPGWEFHAEDYTAKFEGSIKVRIEYPAYDSSREYSEEDKLRPIKTYGEFALMVGDIIEPNQLYRRVLDALTKIELHEMREFLRLKGGMFAPFHPHTVRGMRNWNEYVSPDLLADLASDFQFGIA